MAEGPSPLFDPITVRSHTIRNRVVMAPMVTLYGVATDRACAYYGARARGGVGLVIVEAVAVHRFQSDLGVDTLSRLAATIHEGGARAVVQLFVQDRADPDATWPPGTSREPAEIPLGELGELQEQLAHAARVCTAAGFDGVEVHGAHCFFLNAFLSPERNRRRDRYGRDAEGRMRMGLECARVARKAIGAPNMLLYRHTPRWAGYDLPETIEFCRRLRDEGVDVLDISPSTEDGLEPGTLAARIRAAVGPPVIAVGGMSRRGRAEKALSDGACDLVAIGRGLLADPDWAEKTRTGQVDRVVQCVECGVLCGGNLSRGEPIGCTVNPRTGHEYEDT